LNATFFPHPAPLQKGDVSLVSQSGGVAGLMLYESADAGVGIAKFASIGNRVNIDFHDMVRYLGQDDETEVICLFVEGTEHARSMYDEMSHVEDTHLKKGCFESHRKSGWQARVVFRCCNTEWGN
jgi:acyl-CoA synthetase (NDP forming)